MIVRLRDGEAATGSGKHDRAFAQFAANLTVEKRAAKDELWSLMPTAMLPDPAGNLNTIPTAPTLASLVAWSRLGTARSLLALGRDAEAQQEFRAIRAGLARWPATAENRETMNAVDSWARLGIAEAAFATGNHDEAFRLLMSGEGWPWGLPKDLETRKKELTQKLITARNQMDADQLRRQQRMTPEQLKARRQREDMDQFQKQRDQIAKQLEDSNLPPADRRALESSLAELDRMIEAGKSGSRRAR